MEISKTATLVNIRINIFTKEGTRFHFNLYRDMFVTGYFSPCQRVRVYPHRVEQNGEKVTVGDQYHVTVNGKPCPENQYSILRARKPAQYRAAAASKQTLGRYVPA